MTDMPRSALLHGTAVALDGHGVLILGPSGSGKSALAVQMMALGAGLIADDSTWVWRDGDGLWVRAPDSLPQAIEVRGIGLIRAPLTPPAPLRLVVDLGTPAPERLPLPQTRAILGHSVALIHKIEGAHFPAALVQYVRGGGVIIP